MKKKTPSAQRLAAWATVDHHEVDESTLENPSFQVSAPGMTARADGVSGDQAYALAQTFLVAMTTYGFAKLGAKVSDDDPVGALIGAGTGFLVGVGAVVVGNAMVVRQPRRLAQPPSR